MTGDTMRTRLLALVLLIPGLAMGQAVIRTNRSASSSKVTVSPAQNAVLYALGDSVAPGCYASGSTALAVNGTGTPVAMTFVRNSVASAPDTPGQGYLRSCAAHQLRVTGQRRGALLDAPGTNLLTTPTDAPTSSAPWSLIAAGPTVAADAVTGWIDGTATTAKVTESAAAITGVQQSVTATAVKYCMSATFLWSSRQCWGMSIDGATVHAKFDVKVGSVTYAADSSLAGVEHLPRGWVRAWTCATPSAGTITPQWFATAACTDNTKAATGGTAETNLARMQFEKAVNVNADEAIATSYTPAGTNRPLEALSWPISVASGNVCIGAKFEPSGSTFGEHAVNVVAAYGATKTLGAANSMYLIKTTTGAVGTVYDSTGTALSVYQTITNAQQDRPHAYKLCTSTTGAISLGIDGAVSRNTTGTGTAILSTPPTTLYVGTVAGAPVYQGSSSAAYSDVVACNVSDPHLCGDWGRASGASNGAIGDSIVVGVGVVGVTVPWTQTVETATGQSVTQIARGGWTISDGATAWDWERGHRFRRVAVALGANEAFTGGGEPLFESLRQLYVKIIAEGATPIPMTILPKNLTGAQEQARQDANAAILAWCAREGYRCADSSGALEDPASPGHLLAAYDSGDHVHPNQDGLTALGAFMAPYFQ